MENLELYITFQRIIAKQMDVFLSDLLWLQ